MRRVAAVLAVVLAAASLTACSHSGDGDAYVLDLRGTATLTTSGRAQQLTTGRHRLRVGQLLAVARGSAVLGLPGARSLELRGGTTGSVVRIGPRPTLVDGDALALAGDGDTLSISAGGALVGVRGGAARLRRAAGVTVAVYTGRASVSSRGRAVGQSVPALRQITISDSGVLPRRPVPLVYDRVDPDGWDIRYLNAAIDLGGQLDRRVRVLDAKPPPAALDASYLEATVPALRSAKGFRAEFVDARRSVGETIVGASIALGGPGNLSRRWTGAFRFREQGADWGLVALDQRARRASVLGVLDGVLDRAAAVIEPLLRGPATASPLGGPATPTTSSSPPVASPASPTGTAPQVQPAPSAPPSPTTTLVPKVSPPLLPPAPSPTPAPSLPGPLGSVLQPATSPNPVHGLLDGLVGNGGQQGTSTVSGAVGAITGTATGVLQTPLTVQPTPATAP